MAHHHLTSGYSRLVERLNRFPQGAPPSDALFRILSILMTEQDAGRVALLPIRPFDAKKAASIWKLPLPETRRILDDLAGRALLVDIRQEDDTLYALPPPMAGFFEFSLMRTRGDIDQKTLSELFYQYLNVEDAFILDLFTRGDTQLGRTFVHEPSLTADNALVVLDYERASHVIRSASHRGVSLCYCRHKMEHLGKACTAPMEICMTFNTTADSLIRHGHARSIDESECMDLLARAYDHSLVQFGENVRERVNFICNCCGCCCEAMLTAKRFGLLHPIHTTNFIPVIESAQCTGCGRCASACPVEAIRMIPREENRAATTCAEINADLCLGCGICVRKCSRQAITLVSRPRRVITPVNSTHRIVVMAIERGCLQNLIFDNQALWNHRALAAIFGVIFKLPPIKRLLASQQIKSRYLDGLLSKIG